MSVLDGNIKDFVRLSSEPDCDQHVSFILSIAYTGFLGSYLDIANTLQCTKTVEKSPI
ncbi:hypothetical protein F5Y06DRAFT_269568 [Hypoxylon sp. FL0890]|nr:hypothetical protein F5Y06DRAFT_269568 [Hypoxylon sp. FL0890]